MHGHAVGASGRATRIPGPSGRSREHGTQLAAWPLVASQHRRFRGEVPCKWYDLHRGIIGATRVVLRILGYRCTMAQARRLFLEIVSASLAGASGWYEIVPGASV